MELVKWEVKKLLSLPMIFIFMVLCILFNLFMAYSFSWGEGVEYVQFINKVTKEIGGQMGEEFDRMAAALPEQEGREWLLAETSGRTDLFEGYQTVEIADYYIGYFGMTGFVADALERKYTKLQGRVEELAERDASMDLAAAGMTRVLLEHLFGQLCRMVITEGMLLAVFLALYLCGNEQMQRTHWIVYTTRTGRLIMREKWAAGIGVALLGYGILAGSMVGGFAGIWRMGEIWKADLSSQFYMVSDLGAWLPFVSWADFTVGGYLAAVIGMGAVVVAIFYGLGFLFGLLVRHMYGGFLAVLVFVAINFELIIIAGNGGFWGMYEIMQWTPVGVWWEVPLWFSEMGASRLVGWQECWNGGIWSVIFLALNLGGYRIFCRKDR